MRPVLTGRPTGREHLRMRSVTDHAPRSLSRTVLIAVALTGCLIECGCSQLQSFRNDVLPAFGTTFMSRPNSRPTPSTDLYAQRFGDLQSQTAIARRGDAQDSERSTRGSGGSDHAR